MIKQHDPRDHCRTGNLPTAVWLRSLPTKVALKLKTLNHCQYRPSGELTSRHVNRNMCLKWCCNAVFRPKVISRETPNMLASWDRQRKCLREFDVSDRLELICRYNEEEQRMFLNSFESLFTNLIMLILLQTKLSWRILILR